jgi:hypothetical protein
MRVISNQDFAELEEHGHVVPHNRKAGIVREQQFVVGKEYQVANTDKTKTLNVVCTQNMPYNLRKI